MKNNWRVILTTIGEIEMKTLKLFGLACLLVLLMFRVAYKSKLTGAEGHGNWYTDKKLVEGLVIRGNLSYPEIDHWVEKKDTKK